MKHYTEDNYHPTTSIGFALSRARNELQIEMDAALKELDITMQQMGVILSMARNMASTPFELSKLLKIDTGLMTRMLDKLEKQGLLVRSRSVDDRRSVNLELTAKGRQTAKKIPTIAPNVLNQRLKNFTPAEFIEFHRLLGKFLEG
ncbi:transcriptional regulator, MarR family [Collimonas sp. OK307]|uniref:MarR family winged helix-turn-helix transcriptional regulator n=1 Tax=Collimonas sp. OK307 TaxID=1801620 RepID=UPI0008EF5CE5|nr:MarR family transcriptional regulator [Collimonas sp. OK307]SFI32467.1 transcriptional regulator, MarR family [Collimonas sp. OK307]